MLRKYTPLLLAVLIVLIIATVSSRGEKPLPEGVKADKVIVEKHARQMILLSKGRVVKKYKISLGRNPKGPKVRAGDRKTPEGAYVIDSRNPRSRYHLSLRISYPNLSDTKRAKQLGVSSGGDIMIHGIRKGFGWLGPLHRLVNWTKGCIAVTNREIEEIWRAVPNGTQIEIRP
ncbi:MAG: L,D-transpeptidase family protein [Planctomycetota bacterium]|jgi:murein L,D-transpeptidase YafK